MTCLIVEHYLWDLCQGSEAEAEAEAGEVSESELFFLYKLRSLLSPPWGKE